jgi:hypothetical protein
MSLKTIYIYTYNSKIKSNNRKFTQFGEKMEKGDVERSISRFNTKGKNTTTKGVPIRQVISLDFE